MQQHDTRERDRQGLFKRRQAGHEQFRDEGRRHEFGQQDAGSQAHQHDVEHQARQTPGLPITSLCLIAHEDGEKRRDQRTAGDQIKERVRQAKCRVVGGGLCAGAEEGIKQHLPYQSEHLRSYVGQGEEESTLSDAEAAQREVGTRAQTRGAEAKCPAPPVPATAGRASLYRRARRACRRLVKSGRRRCCLRLWNCRIVCNSSSSSKQTLALQGNTPGSSLTRVAETQRYPVPIWLRCD